MKLLPRYTPPRKSANSKPSGQWIPLLLVLVLATGLYVYQLDTESLWIDELYSIKDAEVLANIAPVRPLYFFLLHIWMQFNLSELWLRLLSIWFGLGTIVFTYLLGCRVVNQSTGLAAAILLTLSPLFINHAQEVRFYTLSCFLGVGGSLALSYALEESRYIRFAPWGWWVGARLLAMLTTPLNVLLLLPDSLLIIWRLRHRRRLLFTMGGILLVIGIISLPWLSQLGEASINFMGDWVAHEAKPGITSIVGRLTSFTARWPLRIVGSPLSHFYKLYTVMLVGMLGCVPWVLRRYPRLMWVVIWGFLPGGVLLAVSLLLGPIWLPRYLLFVAPYFLILLAASFLEIVRWQQKLAIVIALMYTVAVGSGLHHYYTTSYRADWRGVAQAIREQEQPGDVIALCITNSRPLLAIDYYYHGSAPIEVLEVVKDGCVNTLPQFDSRLWLVYLHTTGDSQKFQQELQAQSSVETQQTFSSDLGVNNDIELFLLTQDSPSSQLKSTLNFGSWSPPLELF